MLTSLDIKKLQNIFVTKKEFKEEIKVFATKKEMTAGFDALMHELKAIREELTLSGYRRSENSDKIVDHEDRISSIETKITF